MKHPISVNLPFREPIEFEMDLDAGVIVDEAIAYCMNKWGACEPEVCNVMARAVRPGDFVVDVGANIGFFTLLLARLVGETGQVVAFEPAPQNIQKLKDNIALNRFSQVRQVSQPLWSSQAPVALWLAQDGGLASLARSPWAMGQIALQATTLAAAFPQPPYPRLIKLDAEGAEYNILMGAGDMLRPAATPYVLCEVNEGALKRLNRSGAMLRSYMLNRGYELFMINADGQLPTLVPLGTKLTSTAFNLNVLFSTLPSVAEAWPEIAVTHARS